MWRKEELYKLRIQRSLQRNRMGNSIRMGFGYIMEDERIKIIENIAIFLVVATMLLICSQIIKRITSDTHYYYDTGAKHALLTEPEEEYCEEIPSNIFTRKDIGKVLV